MVETARAQSSKPGIELVPLAETPGRVLARPIHADRDYPPTSRSVRDGFAVRAADLPGTLRVTGEVRAGTTFSGEVHPGECVEIMTGAPLPRGADAVVMVEHVLRDGDMRGRDMVTPQRPVRTGDFINAKGAEACTGAIVIDPGVRLDFAHIGVLATVGMTEVPVYRQVQVAILATGDEIVDGNQRPLEHQIRNSNSHTLAAQVRRSGGSPHILPVARDEYNHTREVIHKGLEMDLLLLSGGVSAGKYDIVEQVLADLGAEFFFTRVLIQPGQPLVFGQVSGTFFFGLPGNPASTMVCFEIFARAALDVLSGLEDVRLPLMLTRIDREFRHKTGLTRFLPASVSSDGALLTPVPWQGSSDVAALARANAFLVARDQRESWSKGDLIEALLR